MQKYKKRLLQLGVILFICINFILVYVDDEGKVDRLASISDWTQTFEANLEEKLYTKGVLLAKEEHNIYFDKNVGSFESFMVEVGSQVNRGDPLFSYKVVQYHQAKAELLEKTNKLEAEVAAIEQAIRKMTAFQIPETNTKSESNFAITEDRLKLEFPQDPIQANLLKEQFLIEKEQEKAEKNATLASVKRQLNELQSSGDTITVESSYSGVITHVSKQLEDPIVTIASNDLHVEGELSEKERPFVKSNLPVEVEVEETKMNLKGTVSNVSDITKEDAAVQRKSTYPFMVHLQKGSEGIGTGETTTDQAHSVAEAQRKQTDNNEENETSKRQKPQEQAQAVEQLLPGYHVNLAITTKASQQATTLPDQAVHHRVVWKMTDKGRLIKQKVKTGIVEDDRIEITSGIITGEVVATEPESQFRHDATFITPLSWENGFKHTISPKGLSWYEFLITGIVAR